MDDDTLRPQGTVSRTCACGWGGWHDPLSPEATVIPYVCTGCRDNPETGCRCSACNRHFKTRHLDLVAMGYHKRCPSCAHIPPMQFADKVHCWACTCDSGLSDTGECCGDATQEKRMPNNCDCEACWQRWYHVCDKHAADWMYDKSNEEQKAIMRRRGARIIELEDGAWTFQWPQRTPETN